MIADRYFPDKYYDSVHDIPYEALYSAGYRALIFDIDNTLVHHGDDSNADVDSFFKRLHGIGFATLLLSNNSEQRIKRFNENIQTLFIADADKPNTRSYLQALDMLRLEAKRVIVIGDQIFTDILGARRSGIPCILVHFIRQEGEQSIGLRRYVERAILLLQRICWWKRGCINI